MISVVMSTQRKKGMFFRDATSLFQLSIALLKKKKKAMVAQMVKNMPVSAGDIRDMDSIPGSGRSPGEGNGNPLQYSCLGNARDRGAWWAI